jgi:hypothetical protein
LSSRAQTGVPGSFAAGVEGEGSSAAFSLQTISAAL